MSLIRAGGVSKKAPKPSSSWWHQRRHGLPLSYVDFVWLLYTIDFDRRYLALIDSMHPEISTPGGIHAPPLIKKAFAGQGREISRGGGRDIKLQRDMNGYSFELYLDTRRRTPIPGLFISTFLTLLPYGGKASIHATLPVFAEESEQLRQAHVFRKTSSRGNPRLAMDKNGHLVVTTKPDFIVVLDFALSIYNEVYWVLINDTP